MVDYLETKTLIFPFLFLFFFLLKERFIHKTIKSCSQVLINTPFIVNTMSPFGIQINGRRLPIVSTQVKIPFPSPPKYLNLCPRHGDKNHFPSFLWNRLSTD